MSIMHTRELEVAEPIVNEEIIAFSVASSEPYLRKDYDEVFFPRVNGKAQAYYEALEISQEAIDFTHLIDERCPFIMEHDHSKQLGVVEKAYITDEKLYVDVRFSTNTFAQKVLKDILSGIRRNVSVGYEIRKVEIKRENGQLPIVYVTSWMPYEASSVSCPADPTVGYKRSLDTHTQEEEKASMEEEEKSKKELEELEEEKAKKACEEEEEVEKAKKAKKAKKSEDELSEIEELKARIKALEEEAAEAKEEAAETKEEAAEAKEEEKAKKAKKTEEESAEAKDEAEIRALGKAFNRSLEAETYIKEKRSLNEFKNLLTQPYKEEKSMERKFNIARALLDKVGKIDPEKASLERSIIEENRRNFNVHTNDIVVTQEQVRAGFDGTADAALHPAEYRPDLYAGTLAKENTLYRVGATVVPTAGESVSYAVCTSGLNGYYVDPNNPVPSGNPAFAQKTLTPHTYGARTFVSHLSQLQDRPEAAAIAMDELFKGMDFVKDVKAFQGSGSSGEPTGILNTAGLNTVPLTGTLDITTAQAFEKKIRESGDYSRDLKWVFGTDAYYTWASTPVKTTALNEFLIDYKTGKCIGYEAICSPAVPASAVILGNFSELLVADFGGIKLNITQDLNYGASDAYQIAGIADNDISVRRPASFTKGV